MLLIRRKLTCLRRNPNSRGSRSPFLSATETNSSTNSVVSFSSTLSWAAIVDALYPVCVKIYVCAYVWQRIYELICHIIVVCMYIAYVYWAVHIISRTLVLLVHLTIPSSSTYNYIRLKRCDLVKHWLHLARELVYIDRPTGSTHLQYVYE